MDGTYIPIARFDDLVDDQPSGAEADGIDLVLVRRGESVHVFEGRCPHRGALLADGRVEGPNLVCGVHGWDYRLDTGVSAYNPAERIYKFSCRVERGEVLLDKDELVDYRSMRPERAVASTYDRLFDDPHQDTAEEPFISEIHRLASRGLAGAHGAVAAMGVPRAELPTWDDLQVLTAQLHPIAVSNVALQAIGCVGMRACHTDNCPMGIATQKPHLRARLPVRRAAEQLTRYFGAVTELMVVLARACGHDSLSHFTPRDLTSWKRDVAELVGVQYAGVTR
jgi:nitrite reductase/ring-hydroxylating ferredoxin subunit